MITYPLSRFPIQNVLEVLSSLPLAIHGVISLSAPFIWSRRYRDEGSFPSLCTTTCYCTYRLALIM